MKRDEKMQKLIDRMIAQNTGGDPEGAHKDADAILSEAVLLLGPLGKELVAAFDALEKWYG